MFEYNIVEYSVNMLTSTDELFKIKEGSNITRQEYGRNEFIRLVNEQCLYGWEPVGGVSYVDKAVLNQPGTGPYIYSQAMKRIINS